ncbi:transcriptional regulator [Streptomyces sp. fd1-xmd]|uniref:transcriptional regulator n=1 Tax=Streptomyces sp. fd1-xmd TaxID=1812480 RepID=UPI00099088E7|nr:transcriptional regulator [Streptomyces sp. fd1-xmd]AQT73984.1 transcriptional regulator [Streptomyces sp. fd1-xmd]
MPRPTGNARLRAARLAAGYRSQQDLIDALARRGVNVGIKQVQRWESETPPWPYPEARRALQELLGQDMEQLGFERRPGTTESGLSPARLAPPARGAVRTRNATQPASVASDYLAVTRAHRQLYWSVAPATLHPAVVAHAGLGEALLPATAGQTHQTLAAALAESHLLAGRIEFFDQRAPDRARDTWVQALQAAGEADDPLLGSAILAHMAFVPGWSGDRLAASERMIAARTYARRAPASAEFLAWLDAVEAECETRCGNTRTALNLIAHGEDVLAAGGAYASPEWMDWFSVVRLAAFKGNTELKAGRLPQARETLLRALADLPADSDKQCTVILGDLGAVEAAASNPEAAAEYALRALDLLETHWYATGLERVRDVRRALVPWQHERCVRDLDDRLYGWGSVVSALTN